MNQLDSARTEKIQKIRLLCHKNGLASLTVETTQDNVIENCNSNSKFVRRNRKNKLGDMASTCFVVSELMLYCIECGF